MKAAIKSLVLATSLVSVSALAGTISINEVNGNWTSVTGGADVNYIDNNGDVSNSEEIRWGKPHKPANPDMKQSGYRFKGKAPAAFNVEPGKEFVVGYFTHFNYTIFNSISKARLDITMNLAVDGGAAMSKGPYTFSFVHDETQNICQPSPSCSDDIVTLNSIKTQDSFVYGGKKYTLKLTGFRDMVSGEVSDTFRTKENKDNTAEIIGKFVVSTDVSEPATLALFGLGLMGLGVARRRNK